jgi:flagellum-specific peptidoglycan hydrolase FlgJ
MEDDMGKLKIKNLGKKRKRKLYDLFIKIISCLFLIVLVLLTTKCTLELYKPKNIESSKFTYYMDIADEAGDYKIQLNWKEIMAVEMAMNDGDLSNIRKADSLNVAKKFISNDETILNFEDVLENMKFNQNYKNMANKYKSELEEVYLITDNEMQIKFIEKIKDGAKKNYENYKILPSITMAQCILESGWGQSKLSQASNNLFGIKADKSWQGESIEVSTTENYDDKVNASFRVYESVEESINDHAKFLVENKRYTENGLFNATHYTTQAKALEDAGYSTKKDENGKAMYASMLIKLIKNYNLQLFDWEVQKN